jgi:uncharacterized protein (DUF58 family)
VLVARRLVFILFIFSLLAGAITGGNIFYRLSYLWIFLFLGGWLWARISLQGVSIKRSARSLRAQVGQIFEERFDVHNNNRLLRLWLEIRDEADLPGSRGSRVLTLIRGREGRSYLVRTRLVQRGVFTLGPTSMTSGDIFGLFQKNNSAPALESLLVFPTMVNILEFPNPPGLLPGGEALRRRTTQITPNAAGVREYAPGDALSRIHWLSTARREKIMVKEFELDPLADVWIFLDAERSVQAGLPHPPPSAQVDDFWRGFVSIPLAPTTEEYGVSVAASLARYFLRKSRAVGFVSAGQQLALLPPDRGGRQLGKILEALAMLKAEGEMPLRGLVETQARHLPRGSTAILITPSVRDDTVLVVDYLSRRGLRPVAVFLDAASFNGEPGTPALIEQIRLLGLPTRRIANGDDISQSLSLEFADSIKNGNQE